VEEQKQETADVNAADKSGQVNNEVLGHLHEEPPASSAQGELQQDKEHETS
jgi:hypothetical protein